MSYISITEKDQKEMLESAGVNDVNDLFADIPESIRLDKMLNLPEKLSEFDLERHLNKIALKNENLISFLGAGAYQHYIPAVVDQLASRSEFYTAYTPYQPEVSQGTLTAIFEFQTMICRLTSMDIANASMYDGATALAESILMASRSNRKKKVIISNTLHPNYREVVNTYAWATDIDVTYSQFKDGITSSESIDEQIDNSVSAVVIQNPNFFGCLEKIKEIAEITHKNKALLIVVVTEPMSLALLKAPGNIGADIVCGEAQGFGNPIGFGGPMLGFISAKEQFARKMPGRLTGKTTDTDGNEAYVLTLQTREQHIRREKATSNICSNQGLCALRSVIYLSHYGNKLRELAILNHKRASYLKKLMIDKGFEPIFNQPFFNEFVLKFIDVKKLHDKLKVNGYIAGLYLGNYYDELKDCVLINTSELHSSADIDRFIDVLESVV